MKTRHLNYERRIHPKRLFAGEVKNLLALINYLSFHISHAMNPSPADTAGNSMNCQRPLNWCCQDPACLLRNTFTGKRCNDDCACLVPEIRPNPINFDRNYILRISIDLRCPLTRFRNNSEAQERWTWDHKDRPSLYFDEREALLLVSAGTRCTSTIADTLPSRWPN